MTEIRPEYRPREQFVPFHARTQRWAVLVCHRRAGKTVATLNDVIARALAENKPDGRYAFVAPYYNQVKDLAWSYLKRYAAPFLAEAPREVELSVVLNNGARIRLYGGDNPDRIRGIYLDGVVMDEFGDMLPNLWGDVIRPLLADRKGWATFIGTPKGKNSFFELWAGDGKKWPGAINMPAEWFSLMLRASATGLLDANELAEAKSQMGDDQFAQEFECSFEAAVRGAFYAEEFRRIEAEGKITKVDIDRAHPVHVAWDIGVDDPMALWCFQIGHGFVNVVDYYESSGRGFDHYIDWLNERDYRGVDFVPHDARMREPGAPGARTRIETLRLLGEKIGRSPKLVTDHKLMDGINAARKTLPYCRFDAQRCAYGLKALREYKAEWDADARVFKKTPKHDWASHAADAFRYLAMSWREPIAAETPQPIRGANDMTMDELVARSPVRRRDDARI